MALKYKWTFRTKFRARALGWRGSKTAISHLKTSVSEIRKVSRSDPLAAGEGVVVLMERLWPAFQDIDTSTGALGNAVNKTLYTLIPLPIAAPADPKTRSKWLQRLCEAVQEDGVEYLHPLEERWGEVAVYPELMNEYADRLRFMVRRNWSDETPGGYVRGTTICLSCLLEVGRYSDLLELLGHARPTFWSYRRFGAEALLRQGLHDAALAYAEDSRDPSLARYDDPLIDRFCEDLLINIGREEDAYQRFGLKTGSGATYLSIYNATLRRYPSRDKRKVLLDLIAARGQSGKWFAAAKNGGFLDIALECAASRDAEPATLIRAARDFAATEPRFATQVSLLAMRGLLNGSGYDPGPEDMLTACDHFLAAARELGEQDWAMEQVAVLAEAPCASDRVNLKAALSSFIDRQVPGST